MKEENIEIGMPVVYLPHYCREIKDENLGIVSSKNDKYVFVKYDGNETACATRVEDLFSLDNRPDLVDKMGLDVKPINRICELWLEEKEAFKNVNSLL